MNLYLVNLRRYAGRVLCGVEQPKLQIPLHDCTVIQPSLPIATHTQMRGTRILATANSPLGFLYRSI